MDTIGWGEAARDHISIDIDIISRANANDPHNCRKMAGSDVAVAILVHGLKRHLA